MVLEVVRAERDAGHLDRVARPLRRGDRAHERLVAVADVRIDHVEVALVDRHVDRLADRPAGVVEVGRDVGQLHEVAEVLDRAVAPAAVEVADERRAVVRREDRVHPADLDVALGVARVLGELARRGGLDDRAAHPAREPDALAVDVGAGLAQQSEGLGVAAEVEADLLEDRVGVLLDERQALLAEDLERRELAGQERDVLGVGGEPDRLAGGSTAAPPALGVSSISRPPSSPAATGRASSPLVAARRARHRAGPGAALGAGPRPAPGSGRRPSCAGTPSPRRSAPGSAARPRSRSSRRAGRRPRSRVRASRRQQRDAARRCRRRCRPSATCAEVAVGDEAEHHRVDRVDLAAEGAGQPDLVDAPRCPSWSISSRTPAYSAALASWIARTSFWVIAMRGPRRPVAARGGRR